MRRFRRSERGLSEIVGTLMLVVIVVGAATLLAAFVASYQKQLQTEETFSHDQGLESIQILGLTTTVGNGTFTTFAFTLASEYINPSGILDISINGVPLLDFAWDNVTTNTHGTYNVGNVNNLIVQPFDQVIISLCLVATCSTAGGNITFSFLSPSDVPLPNHYIKFDVFTHLHNDFSRVYLPPTPLAVVSELNPSGNNPITLLDGSTSFQPGTNASIVDWSWTVTGDGLESTSTSLSGAALTVNTIPSINGALSNGTVNGTRATATFAVPSGFVYGSGDAVEFTLGGNLTIAGNGTCSPLTATAIRAGATGSVSGTTLTVVFNFTTNIPAGCIGARLTLAPTGVSLNLTLSALGEEYEISPALAPLASNMAYSVTLGVTNSDGLEGAVTVSYQPPT